MFVTIARIQEEVAKSYDLPAEAMTRRNNRGEGHNRVNARKISHPRQLAMYLAFELTHHSKSRIGQLFGGRDHTTVLYAIRVVKQRLESDEVLRQRAESIRKSLKLVDNFPICVCPPPPVESLNCSMGKEIIKQRPPKGEWRKREAAERKRMGDVYSQLMRPIPYEPKVREEDRVRRDPCIKCGTRADIGCVHTRVAA